MAWLFACRRVDLPADRGWPVRVGGRHLAIFDSENAIYAIDNRCAHVGNPIDDGAASGGVVTCPWHGWRYDLHTGDQLTVFGRRPGLAVYPVRVEGDDVLVDLPEVE